MKHIVILSLFVFTCLIASAQTEKGTLMPGGGFSFQSSEAGTTFTLSPRLGFFVKNNFVIGSGIVLGFSDDYMIYGIGPFARVYFGKSMKGKFFLHAGATVVGDTEGPDPYFSYEGTFGYAIFLNQSIAFEIGANYTRNDDFGIFSVNGGFNLHFRRKSK